MQSAWVYFGNTHSFLHFNPHFVTITILWLGVFNLVHVMQKLSQRPEFAVFFSSAHVYEYIWLSYISSNKSLKQMQKHKQHATADNYMKLQSFVGLFPKLGWRFFFTTPQCLAHAMSIYWCLHWKIVSQPQSVLHKTTVAILLTQIFHL